MRSFLFIFLCAASLLVSCSEEQVCDSSNVEIIGIWKSKESPNKRIAFQSDGTYIDNDEVLMSSICVSGFWSYNDQLQELTIECNFILGDVMSNFVLEVVDCDLIGVDFGGDAIMLERVN